MDCEICYREESDLIVILPIRKPDGSLITMACLSCAKKSGVYCQKHRRPHTSFGDGQSTACLLCIEDVVVHEEEKADGIFVELQQKLPDKELNRLGEWIDIVSPMTGNSKAICVLRALATRAVRSDTNVDDIKGRILQDQSVDSILPQVFPL